MHQSGSTRCSSSNSNRSASNGNCPCHRHSNFTSNSDSNSDDHRQSNAGSRVHVACHHQRGAMLALGGESEGFNHGVDQPVADGDSMWREPQGVLRSGDVKGHNVEGTA